MPYSINSFMQNKYAQIVRFALIGGGAAAFYTILNYFALGFFVNIPKALISSLCYSLFIIPVYLLQKHFAFESKSKHSKALPRYVIVQIIALLCNFLAAKTIFDIWHLPNFIGSGIAIIATSLMSFLAMKLWTFKD